MEFNVHKIPGGQVLTYSLFPFKHIAYNAGFLLLIHDHQLPCIVNVDITVIPFRCDNSMF